MRSLPHLPDAFEVATGNGSTAQGTSPDTRPDSDESWEAFAELHKNDAVTGTGQAKSVTFGGLEFPPSGGAENGRRWLD